MTHKTMPPPHPAREARRPAAAGDPTRYSLLATRYFLRLPLALLAALLLSSFLLPTSSFSAATFDNPVNTARGHPDPWVYKHTDGAYYGLCTFGKASIGIWRSRDLLELYRTKPKIIWTAPKTGWNTQDIWAPEIHYLDGSFYIYYAATNDKRGPNRRMGVLKCAGPDPINDPWTDLGKLTMPDGDTWAIDGTVLQQNNKLYFIWSGQRANTDKSQKLYIIPMASPTKLTGKRLEISRPTYDWERQGNRMMQDVNEGPEILKHAGKTFVIYSASFCGTRHYKLGMLTIPSDADPMVLSNWKKSKVPLFQEANGLYGPGHCSFTTDAAGRDWIIYHARLAPGDNDGDRYACLQPFTWTDTGYPNFGSPQKTNIPAPATK